MLTNDINNLDGDFINPIESEKSSCPPSCVRPPSYHYIPQRRRRLYLDSTRRRIMFGNKNEYVYVLRFTGAGAGILCSKGDDTICICICIPGIRDILVRYGAQDTSSLRQAFYALRRLLKRHLIIIRISITIRYTIYDLQ